MQPVRKVTYEKLVKAVSGAEYRTLQSIGDEFGLTRERIRQLINENNLRTAPARQKPDRRKSCRYCGELVSSTKTPKSGMQYHNSHKLCRKEHHESLWLTIPCSHCDKDIQIRKSDRRLKSRKMDYLFCNHRCAAKYRIEHETDRWGIWSKSNGSERKKV
tara:strand:- start:40 stop:519 length:480 start_codon:yes stop_codon:yes gene_type:complete